MTDYTKVWPYIDPADKPAVEYLFMKAALRKDHIMSARVNLFLREHGIKLDRQAMIDRVAKAHMEHQREPVLIWEGRNSSFYLDSMTTPEDAIVHYSRLIK